MQLPIYLNTQSLLLIFLIHSYKELKIFAKLPSFIDEKYE